MEGLQGKAAVILNGFGVHCMDRGHLSYIYITQSYWDGFFVAVGRSSFVRRQMQLNRTFGKPLEVILFSATRSFRKSTHRVI